MHTERRYLQRALLLRSAPTRLAEGGLKIFNHLRFFFVLGSVSLSTLASQVHFQPLNPGLSCLLQARIQAAWRLVSLILMITMQTLFSGWKTFVITYFLDAHTLFFPASRSRNSCDISAVFCLPLDTGAYPVFEIHTACQRSICNIRIVNEAKFDKWYKREFRKWDE